MTPSTSGSSCYLDCFSGISGDMMLGALLDCGADEKRLLSDLEKLGLSGLQFETRIKKVNSICGCKVEIDSTKRQQFRHLPQILDILSQSSLEEQVVTQATEIFTELGTAEARIHGIELDKVHFHEVGALDTIVDIVGVLLCLSYLDIGHVTCSPLPTGNGFVQCDHGLLPLPAPAVCELLKGIPTYGIELKQELVTPTGAALIKVLADDFGPLPPMTITATGYGAGSRTLDNGQPNLLRCIIGTGQTVTESQLVEVIETNIDDSNPELFPYLFERLFDQGALDVTLTPIQVKKGRPGFSLQIISPPSHSHILKEIVFTETTAIGLRFRKENRSTLVRKNILVTTPWGEIAAKQVQTPDGIVVYPEFEECKKVAANNNLPLKEVYKVVQSTRIPA